MTFPILIRHTQNKTIQQLHKSSFVLLALLCLTGLISSALALFLGFTYTLLLGNPYEKQTHKVVNWGLKAAVVGLGFGMNFQETLAVGAQGMQLTFFSIILTLILGFGLGKALGIDKKVAYLISCGTAICGGSAIATVSPVIDAKENEISVALGIVFALNALALLIFPMIGHYFDMSQGDFGLWSAIAIHDTSSVVGASMAYGDEALKIATTVKMARSLWVIPIAALSMLFFRNKGNKVKIPYFIGLFILAILAHSYIPLPEVIYGSLSKGAKTLLILLMFLIGSKLTMKSLSSFGWKPFVLAVSIWAFISLGSLWYILN